MRQLVMCGVVILSVMSILKADYPVVSICADSGDQTVPDVDGGLVVWQDARTGNADIYWKHFADPNDPNAILMTGNQKNPAVSGTIIVWQDEQVSTNKNIYGCDLTTRLPFPVCTASGNQQNPDVSGSIIVWQDYRNGNSDIYLYNLSTETEEAVCTDGAAQLNPAIDGSLVVWQDNRNGKYEIYRCDLSVKPYTAAAVSPSGFDQYNPAVSGTIVVWHEDRGAGDGADIYAYDLSKSQLALAAGGIGNQNFPSVSGAIVVYHEKLTTKENFDICGVDLSTGAPLAVATGNQDDKSPIISGRRVVWQRNATDIVGAVIPTPTAIEVTWPVSGEMFLAKSEIAIDWRLVDGTAPVNVKIEFSGDGVTGWQTIAASVPFGGGYLWKPVVDVDSRQCSIRVSDAADSLVSDVSDFFTIFQCSPALTADLTGDCFVGLEDVAVLTAQWLSCGNPYNSNWCVE